MNFEYQNDNLILKVLCADDADQVLDFYHSNSSIFDMYELDKPDNFYTLDFIKNLLRAENEAFLHGTNIRFFLFDTNENDSIIGTISFFNIRRGAFFSCQTGYKIDCAHQHLGYGYKMLTMAISIITREYHIHRIEAYIMASNFPSIALVEKSGFKSEGIAKSYVKLKNVWTDHLRYVYICDI